MSEEKNEALEQEATSEEVTEETQEESTQEDDVQVDEASLPGAGKNPGCRSLPASGDLSDTRKFYTFCRDSCLQRGCHAGKSDSTRSRYGSATGNYPGR